jgi:hypothetical protein
LFDDLSLLAAVRAAYADWRATTQVESKIEIQLALDDRVDGAACEDIRVDGARLTLSAPGVSGHADARSGRARARVPSRLVGDPAALAAEVVDTLLLFLLTRSGRTPVHAAGLLLGDTAVVLAGPSGSGKSTLTLAAMERGFSVLSDDTLYIQLHPALRVWGFRRPLHVFPEDAPRFTGATRLRAGKLKAAVPLAAGALAGPAVADKAVLILLERSDRLGLTRLDAAAAEAGLARLDPGFDLLAQEAARAAQALAAGGAWRLSLARDPGAAIDFLRERLSTGLAEG